MSGATVVSESAAGRHKSAADLVPGDVYIERRRYGTRQPKPYRVVAIGPGPTSTIVEVAVECVATGRCGRFNFFRVNRVELVV